MTGRDPEASGPTTAPLRQLLTYRLARVHAKLNAQASRVLRDHAGLTLTQWRILLLIATTQKTSLSELARMSLMDKGLLSRRIKSLIADGLVQTKTDDLDHRVQHLTLTAAGKRTYEKALPVMNARQANLQHCLEPGELTVLFDVLEKLEIAAEQKDPKP